MTSQPGGSTKSAREQYCPTCEQTFPDGTGERCPKDGTRLVRLTAAKDPHVGRELDGRYTITEKLGQGGMGAVYRGEQHSVGREVAIKVVSGHLVSEPEVIKRFLREAKLASRLAHPNAVAVLDFGQTEDGLFYLVMELVAGRTLDAAIAEADGRAFPPERLVRIGAQICDALEGAHALSIVHRDLKPSNVMLLSSGRDLVKVLDFGLAKSVAPDQTTTTMTGAGAVLGTPAFMPPELALGEACDGRADLYSLGCMLYLLGSGALPFKSDSVHELISLHATEPVPPMTGVPRTLARVVERLLAKAPADRYQSAAAAREALEGALRAAAFETLPPVARPRMSAEMAELASGPTLQPAAVNAAETQLPAAKPGRRRWLVPALAGGAAVIGAAAFAIGSAMKAPDPPPAAVQPAPVATPVIVQPPAPAPAPPPAIAPPLPPPPIVADPPKPPKKTGKPPHGKTVQPPPPPPAVEDPPPKKRMPF